MGFRRVVVAHDAALIASLRPDEAIGMWDWLIQNGLSSPLNNAESIMFPANAPCDSAGVVWNQLRGSWNLALQTLGWGRYLAERRGQVPVLWQAMPTNAFLRGGYYLLAPNDPTPVPDASLEPDLGHGRTGLSRSLTPEGLSGMQLHEPN